MVVIQPLSTPLIKPNFYFTLPPTQYHSFLIETTNPLTIKKTTPEMSLLLSNNKQKDHNDA